MNALTTPPAYCNSLFRYKRLLTREVRIGNVPMGGSNPIRLQSMTTTNTMDTLATVEQSIRMIEAGSEYVRITAPSIHEAKNLLNIKNELRKRGYQTPLIADIHFTPNAAETAARIVEKVRVNPGNYADKKRFETIEYTDAAYDSELERIRQRFVPLVRICKEYGTAMRIGTNHGSLSDRIMSRYGDTPLGMVESALEFLRICEEESFYNVVLSMKSSNPQVMVQAYRLLVAKMLERNSAYSGPQKDNIQVVYPLHLGVTEAGEGEDGRIKSATGIGALLEDGIGDTIRVSLTEEPEFEIPVARSLAARYAVRNKPADNSPEQPFTIPEVFNPFGYQRRHAMECRNLGGHKVPVVIIDYSKWENLTPASLFAAGYQYSVSLDKWNVSDRACDYIFTGNRTIDFEIPGTLGLICDYNTWLQVKHLPFYFPFFKRSEFSNAIHRSAAMNFIEITYEEFLSGELRSFTEISDPIVFVFSTGGENALQQLRAMFFEMLHCGHQQPVVVRRHYDTSDASTVSLYAAADCGGLMIDGFGDGIWLTGNQLSPSATNSISFGILQAARMRISKTEYISCPSCGRTLFDLQETTARIRSQTDHLKGIKIGIMGCIVNGPGEMADADYGYVGTGPGKITLYKGKEVVMRNVETANAVKELIGLIKENGDWVERD